LHSKSGDSFRIQVSETHVSLRDELMNYFDPLCVGKIQIFSNGLDHKMNGCIKKFHILEFQVQMFFSGVTDIRQIMQKQLNFFSFSHNNYKLLTCPSFNTLDINGVLLFLNNSFFNVK